MPFVPASNTAELELVYQFNSQICENTLYFQNTGAWTNANLAAACEAVADWWDSFLAASMSSQVELIRVEGRDLTSQAGAVAEYVPPTALVGDLLSDPLPANCAYCVSFRTGLAGRAMRGRNYVLGLTDDQTTGSTILPARKASILAAYGELEAAVQAAVPGAQWVVVSRFVGNTARDNALVTPIITVTGDNTMDSQRRRLPGRGR